MTQFEGTRVGKIEIRVQQSSRRWWEGESNLHKTPDQLIVASWIIMILKGLGLLGMLAVHACYLCLVAIYGWMD